MAIKGLLNQALLGGMCMEVKELRAPPMGMNQYLGLLRLTVTSAYHRLLPPAVRAKEFRAPPMGMNGLVNQVLVGGMVAA